MIFRKDFFFSLKKMFLGDKCMCVRETIINYEIVIIKFGGQLAFVDRSTKETNLTHTLIFFPGNLNFWIKNFSFSNNVQK